jgi:hypothetical protein
MPSAVLSVILGVPKYSEHCVMLYLNFYHKLMKLTSCLLAKNIVLDMTRDELKCLRKKVILFSFFTKKSCIVKFFPFATNS